MTALDHLDTWQLVALASALGWASGVRLYAVLLVVGALGFFDVVALPGGLKVLAHPFVLAASGFMTFVEFFADKIPGVDSGWDLLHTLLRVPVGAWLAGSAMSLDGDFGTGAAVAGGATALLTHLLKSGSRAAINTSPEPFSNWAASLAEDVGVGVLLWLAFAHPFAALVLLVLMVVLAAWLVPKVWRGVRRVLARLSGWRSAPRQDGAR